MYDMHPGVSECTYTPAQLPGAPAALVLLAFLRADAERDDAEELLSSQISLRTLPPSSLHTRRRECSQPIYFFLRREGNIHISIHVHIIYIYIYVYISDNIFSNIYIYIYSCSPQAAGCFSGNEEDVLRSISCMRFSSLSSRHRINEASKKYRHKYIYIYMLPCPESYTFKAITSSIYIYIYE